MLGPPRLFRQVVGALAGAAVVCAPLTQASAQTPAMSLIRDTEIEAIIHKEADPVFVAAGLDPKQVRIYLISDREPNAFTAGGQNIFISTGLILETKNPNQLVGVIAHETGHVAGGHIARSGNFGRAATGPMLLSIGLGILAAIAGSPAAGAALIFNSGYFGELNALTYSREQEARADQAAATYLEAAGLSGPGLVTFFDNFRYQEVFDDEKKFPFFRDHPLTDDRIEALRVRVEHQPHVGVVDTPAAVAEHDIMKAKLDAFLNGGAQVFNDYPDTDTSFPARYARAIAWYKATETDRALKAIDALIADRPDDPYLWELKGQVLFEVGRAKEAEPAHRRSVELDPGAPLLQINLAQALIAQNDPKKVEEAILILHKSLMSEPDNALGWRLMSEAYDAQGNPGMARLAAAEQNFNLGQMLEARTFAVHARELLKKGTPEWRRATDIILASKPTPAQLKELGEVG